MKSRSHSKNILNNEKGFLTLDFIFASVLFYVFASILFSFAITFSVVEAGQYISFSTARTYSVAHVDRDTQIQRAQDKYQQLVNNRAIQPMINSGWFQFGEPEIREFTELNTAEDLDSAIFGGVRIRFNAPILYKQLPLVGETASTPDAFLANIQSFTGVEPSFLECRIFNRARGNQVRALYSEVDGAQYIPQTDNGC